MTWLKNHGGGLVNLDRCTHILFKQHEDPNKMSVMAKMSLMDDDDDVLLYIGTIEACESFVETLGRTLKARDASGIEHVTKCPV